MEIDLIFKIAAIGIIVAVLNQLLIRSGREDQAMMTTLAGLVVVLSILVKQISALFVTINPCSHYECGGSGLWSGACGSIALYGAQAQCPILRAAAFAGGGTGASGAGRVCIPGGAPWHRPPGGADERRSLFVPDEERGRSASDGLYHTLCEEAGAESLAWCVGLAGRCLVLAAAWPLLEEILQQIGSMTG